MNFPRIIFSLFLLQTANSIAAQDMFIHARVDKNKILIGEPLELTISTNFLPDAKVFFVRIDSIEHFELLEKPRIDTSDENDGTYITGVYKITSFDSGHWEIPPFVLGNGIQSEPIPVDVVFSDFDPNQPYHDIKDIIDVKPKKKNTWWWYAAAGALTLTIVLLYIFRKKKPLPVVKTEVSINPYEEAMKQLEELNKTKTDSKQFHTKLVDIFRLYIFRKKGILSLQKTTDDLVLQLKDLNMEKARFEKLSQALRLSDFVKFAKYNPTNEDNQHCYNDILNSIKNIELSGSKASL